MERARFALGRQAPARFLLAFPWHQIKNERQKNKKRAARSVTSRLSRLRIVCRWKSLRIRCPPLCSLLHPHHGCLSQRERAPGRRYLGGTECCHRNRKNQHSRRRKNLARRCASLEVEWRVRMTRELAQGPVRVTRASGLPGHRRVVRYRELQQLLSLLLMVAVRGANAGETLQAYVEEISSRISHQSLEGGHSSHASCKKPNIRM